MSVLVRDESPADRAAIHALVAATLGPAEARLVDDLRAEDALLLSLAAFDGAALVGHVAASRLSIIPRSRPRFAEKNDATSKRSKQAFVGEATNACLAIKGGRASVLAPLAVAAEHRGRGIARRLVTEALERRRAAGDDVMLVLGDPALYGRFGFSAALARPFRTPWDGPHQQALTFGEAGARLGGAVRYPRAFAELG